MGQLNSLIGFQTPRLAKKMENYKLYNGKVILKFDDKNHIYSVNGKTIDGVTSVIQIIDKSGPLMYWAVNQAIDYLKNNLKPGKALDEIEIGELLEEASKQHRISKNRAANIGELTHKYIEGAMKGEKPKMPVNKQIRNGIKAFAKWAKENKFKPKLVERKVYSKRFGYAGTLDSEGLINNKLAIVDIKTSNRIYDEMRYQVAAYQNAREEETGKKYAERWIIRLGKEDGEFEANKLDNYEKDFKGFLAALVLYRRRKELKYSNNGK